MKPDRKKYQAAKKQRMEASKREPGAYVHSERHQTVLIVGKRGELLLSKREADAVLANLQIMYYQEVDAE